MRKYKHVCTHKVNICQEYTRTWMVWQKNNQNPEALRYVLCMTEEQLKILMTWYTNMLKQISNW